MFKYLRSKIPTGHHEARAKDRAEFFKFAKTVHHGFPSKPSCLAYDHKLNLLAIGTRTGLVKIYGAPGVEFIGQHKDELPVLQLFFLPNQGRIISLCENQTLHLWEVNFRDGQGFLDHVKECSTEDRLKKISSCVLRQVESPIPAVDSTLEEGDAPNSPTPNCYSLLIGTESGNIYSLDCQTFELNDFIIYQDAVIQNVPDDYKLNPGPVESISVHPKERKCLLLGYNRGLIVIWDERAASARRTYVSQQGVETVCWHFTGEKFVSAHNDGSYVIWSAEESDKMISGPNIPFGPFPCKPIDRIIWKTTSSGDNDLLVFTGGMPRASYGDRNTVAAQNSEKEVVFDFSSKVMDILALDCADDDMENPHTLMVLCEEEIVAIDLLSENWPQFRLPYLLPLHASPITAAQYVADVQEEFVEKLRDAGATLPAGKFGYSPREWPIQGGKLTGEDKGDRRDLLVTGHEDGSVKFWKAGTASMCLLYCLNTAKLFQGYQDPHESQEEDEEEWPPFRKVGSYDPYSDDPRFGIPRLCLDPKTGILVVGGTAGQTMVWEPSWEPDREMEVGSTEVQIVTDTENFVWKGHQKLEMREGMVRFTHGFVPKSVVQTWPPASVTALGAHAEWGVVAIGTAHGFTLFDYVQNRSVLTTCLLNPDDMSAHATVSEGVMSRMKSFKKSVRDSFRRRRRRAAGAESPRKSPQTPTKEVGPTATAEQKEGGEEAATATASGGEVQKPEDIAGPSGEEKKPETDSQQGGSKRSSPKKESPKRTASPGAGEEDLKPVERSVEARGEASPTSTEQLGSLVRCVYFGRTYVINATTLSNTLWVGTNGGKVQILTLTLPDDPEKRATDEVQCVLAKEIQLQHRAPVLSIGVVDGKDFPLRAHPALGTTKEATPTPAQEGGHRVVLCSEEQLKTFHLPGLKPGRHKFKLTATEGLRVRKVENVTLPSKNDENRWESFVVLMTNEGEVMAFSNHQFRRYLKSQCIRSGDISGILSTVLTANGEGFYLRSSSEWQRFTVAAGSGVTAQCTVELPEGARPPPPAEPSPPPVAGEGEKKDEEEPPLAQSTPEAKDGENAPAPKPADISVLSNESSTLPTDVTVDSIRDYTTQQQTEETHTEKVVDGGTVTITTKTTKMTIVSSGGTVDGEAAQKAADATVVTTSEETRELVNGEAGDDIAKLKAMNIDGQGDSASQPQQEVAAL